MNCSPSLQLFTYSMPYVATDTEKNSRSNKYGTQSSTPPYICHHSDHMQIGLVSLLLNVLPHHNTYIVHSHTLTLNVQKEGK